MTNVDRPARRFGALVVLIVASLLIAGFTTTLNWGAEFWQRVFDACIDQPGGGDWGNCSDYATDGLLFYVFGLSALVTCLPFSLGCIMWHVYLKRTKRDPKSHYGYIALGILAIAFVGLISLYQAKSGWEWLHIGMPTNYDSIRIHVENDISIQQGGTPLSDLLPS